MTTRSARWRPRLLCFALAMGAAALALRAAPTVFAEATQGNGATASVRDLAAAIGTMQRAEAAAAAAAPSLPAAEASADALRARLSAAIAPTGSQLRSLDVVHAEPGAAGLLQRRVAIRISAPAQAIAPALVAVRTTTAALLVDKVTLDGAAATLAAPDPQIVIEGVLWVRPLRGPEG